MRQVLEEVLVFLEAHNKSLKCASIRYGDKKCNLIVGYSSSEYDDFCNSIMFDYDPNVRWPSLEGTLWFLPNLG